MFQAVEARLTASQEPIQKLEFEQQQFRSDLSTKTAQAQRMSQELNISADKLDAINRTVNRYVDMLDAPVPPCPTQMHSLLQVHPRQPRSPTRPLPGKSFRPRFRNNLHKHLPRTAPPRNRQDRKRDQRARRDARQFTRESSFSTIEEGHRGCGWGD